MGAIKSLFATESNESAAVKRQAEGFSNPMYRMLDLGVRLFLQNLFLHTKTISHEKFVVGQNKSTPKNRVQVSILSKKRHNHLILLTK